MHQYRMDIMGIVMGIVVESTPPPAGVDSEVNSGETENR